MKTKRKILQYLDYKKIKKKDFFIQTGIKRGLLDTDKLDKTVSDENITKILVVFPDLNPIWLLTGKGDMILKGGESQKEAVNSELLKETFDLNKNLREKNVFQQAKEQISLLKQQISPR